MLTSLFEQTVIFELKSRFELDSCLRNKLV